MRIYALKRYFGAQKAERYFKGRGISCQCVDLGRRPLIISLAHVCSTAKLPNLLRGGNAHIRNAPPQAEPNWPRVGRSVNKPARPFRPPEPQGAV